METPERPPARNNKTFICPIITVWIFFLLSLINLNSFFSQNPKYFTIIEYIYPLSTLLLLIMGIYITLGLVKRQYKLYNIGFIITIIYTIIQISSRLLLIMENRNRSHLFTNIIFLFIDFIPFIVVVSYRRKIQENYRDTEAFRNINIDLQEGDNQLIQ